MERFQIMNCCHEPKMNEMHLKEKIHQAGLRVTSPRLTVLSIVNTPEKHWDADTIADLARKRLGTMSMQSVYDNLNALAEAGLIRCIEPAGAPTLYEGRVGDNHHHMICRNCRTTIDIDCAVGKAPCLEPNDSHGFMIDEAEVIYWGLCPNCQ